MSKRERLQGIGLDGDGEFRYTGGDGYELTGGTEETHEIMQEVAAKVEEGLRKSGKSIGQASTKELSERIGEAMEKVGRR